MLNYQNIRAQDVKSQSMSQECQEELPLYVEKEEASENETEGSEGQDSSASPQCGSIQQTSPTDELEVYGVSMKEKNSEEVKLHTMAVNGSPRLRKRRASLGSMDDMDEEDEESKASSNPDTLLASRPKRNIISKNLEFASGLSWKEENDLKKALYASLQESKRREGQLCPGSKDSPTEAPKRTWGPKVIDESSQESLGVYSTDTQTDKDSAKPNPQYKSKVHAQRKFAQGSRPNSPYVSPMKPKPSPKKFFTTKKAKTEDFLTFLCLRGSHLLPPHMDFYNIEDSDENGSAPGTPRVSAANSRPGTPGLLGRIVSYGPVNLSGNSSPDRDISSFSQELGVRPLARKHIGTRSSSSLLTDDDVVVCCKTCDTPHQYRLERPKRSSKHPYQKPKRPKGRHGRTMKSCKKKNETPNFSCFGESNNVRKSEALCIPTDNNFGLVPTSSTMCRDELETSNPVPPAQAGHNKDVELALGTDDEDEMSVEPSSATDTGLEATHIAKYLVENEISAQVGKIDQDTAKDKADFEVQPSSSNPYGYESNNNTENVQPCSATHENQVVEATEGNDTVEEKSSSAVRNFIGHLAHGLANSLSPVQNLWSQSLSLWRSFVHNASSEVLYLEEEEPSEMYMNLDGTYDDVPDAEAEKTSASSTKAMDTNSVNTENSAVSLQDSSECHTEVISSREQEACQETENISEPANSQESGRSSAYHHMTFIKELEEAFAMEYPAMAERYLSIGETDTEDASTSSATSTVLQNLAKLVLKPEKLHESHEQEYSDTESTIQQEDLALIYETPAGLMENVDAEQQEQEIYSQSVRDLDQMHTEPYKSDFRISEPSANESNDVEFWQESDVVGKAPDVVDVVMETVGEEIDVKQDNDMWTEKDPFSMLSNPAVLNGNDEPQNPKSQPYDSEKLGSVIKGEHGFPACTHVDPSHGICSHGNSANYMELFRSFLMSLERDGHLPEMKNLLDEMTNNKSANELSKRSPSEGPEMKDANPSQGSRSLLGVESSSEDHGYYFGSDGQIFTRAENSHNMMPGKVEHHHSQGQGPLCTSVQPHELNLAENSVVLNEGSQIQGYFIPGQSLREQPVRYPGSQPKHQTPLRPVSAPNKFPRQAFSDFQNQSVTCQNQYQIQRPNQNSLPSIHHILPRTWKATAIRTSQSSEKYPSHYNAVSRSTNEKSSLTNFNNIVNVSSNRLNEAQQPMEYRCDAYRSLEEHNYGVPYAGLPNRSEADSVSAGSVGQETQDANTEMFLNTLPTDTSGSDAVTQNYDDSDFREMNRMLEMNMEPVPLMHIKGSTATTVIVGPFVSSSPAISVAPSGYVWIPKTEYVNSQPRNFDNILQQSSSTYRPDSSSYVDMHHREMPPKIQPRKRQPKKKETRGRPKVRNTIPHYSKPPSKLTPVCPNTLSPVPFKKKKAHPPRPRGRPPKHSRVVTQSALPKKTQSTPSTGNTQQKKRRRVSAMPQTSCTAVSSTTTSYLPSEYQICPSTKARHGSDPKHLVSCPSGSQQTCTSETLRLFSQSTPLDTQGEKSTEPHAPKPAASELITSHSAEPTVDAQQLNLLYICQPVVSLQDSPPQNDSSATKVPSTVQLLAHSNIDLDLSGPHFSQPEDLQTKQLSLDTEPLESFLHLPVQAQKQTTTTIASESFELATIPTGMISTDKMTDGQSYKSGAQASSTTARTDASKTTSITHTKYRPLYSSLPKSRYVRAHQNPQKTMTVVLKHRSPNERSAGVTPDMTQQRPQPFCREIEIVDLDSQKAVTNQDYSSFARDSRMTPNMVQPLGNWVPRAKPAFIPGHSVDTLYSTVISTTSVPASEQQLFNKQAHELRQTQQSMRPEVIEEVRLHPMHRQLPGQQHQLSAAVQALQHNLVLESEQQHGTLVMEQPRQVLTPIQQLRESPRLVPVQQTRSTPPTVLVQESLQRGGYLNYDRRTLRVIEVGQTQGVSNQENTPPRKRAKSSTEGDPSGEENKGPPAKKPKPLYIQLLDMSKLKCADRCLLDNLLLMHGRSPHTSILKNAKAKEGPQKEEVMIHLTLDDKEKTEQKSSGSTATEDCGSSIRHDEITFKLPDNEESEKKTKVKPENEDGDDEITFRRPDDLEKKSECASCPDEDDEITFHVFNSSDSCNTADGRSPGMNRDDDNGDDDGEIVFNFSVESGDTTACDNCEGSCDGHKEYDNIIQEDSTSSCSLKRVSLLEQTGTDEDDDIIVYCQDDSGDREITFKSISRTTSFEKLADECQFSQQHEATEAYTDAVLNSPKWKILHASKISLSPVAELTRIDQTLKQSLTEPIRRHKESQKSSTNKMYSCDVPKHPENVQQMEQAFEKGSSLRNSKPSGKALQASQRKLKAFKSDSLKRTQKNCEAPPRMTRRSASELQRTKPSRKSKGQLTLLESNKGSLECRKSLRSASLQINNTSSGKKGVGQTAPNYGATPSGKSPGKSVPSASCCWVSTAQYGKPSDEGRRRKDPSRTLSPVVPLKRLKQDQVTSHFHKVKEDSVKSKKKTELLKRRLLSPRPDARKTKGLKLVKQAKNTANKADKKKKQILTRSAAAAALRANRDADSSPAKPVNPASPLHTPRSERKVRDKLEDVQIKEEPVEERTIDMTLRKRPGRPPKRQSYGLLKVKLPLKSPRKDKDKGNKERSDKGEKDKGEKEKDSNDVRETRQSRMRSRSAPVHYAESDDDEISFKDIGFFSSDEEMEDTRSVRSVASNRSLVSVRSTASNKTETRRQVAKKSVSKPAESKRAEVKPITTPVKIKDLQGGKSSTPNSRSNTPTGKPITPSAKATPNKPSTPTARPSTPSTKPSVPIVKQSTPAKPSTPTGKPNTPASKPSTPISKPGTPSAKPSTPPVKPNTPPIKVPVPPTKTVSPKPSAHVKPTPVTKSQTPTAVKQGMPAGDMAGSKAQVPPTKPSSQPVGKLAGVIPGSSGPTKSSKTPAKAIPIAVKQEPGTSKPKTRTESQGAGDIPQRVASPNPVLRATLRESFPNPGDKPRTVDVHTYHPSSDSFGDPIKYFNDIRRDAEPFGMCRIIPPDGWKPECRISDDLKFFTHVQYVHRMQNRWGPNSVEVECIKRHLESQGVKLEPPIVGGVELDVAFLLETVQKLGGVQYIVNKNKWSKVADILKIPKAGQERHSRLYDIYCKLLLSYDTLEEDAKTKLKQQVQTHIVRNVDKVECICKGRRRSRQLGEFFKLSRNLQNMWFKDDPTPKQVEVEYWKIVREAKYHVSVQGAQVDTKVCGSGFPTKKDCPSNTSPYSRHGWNFNILQHNNASILKNLGQISGVTCPTLHISMLFTTSCWARDQHRLPHIVYNHTGSDVIWYSIPASEEDKFAKALKILTPSLIENGKLWLPEDSVMVSPQQLVEQGVSVGHVVLRQGEFLIIFPDTFTASVSCGYNISETLHFATASWLPHGIKAAKECFESFTPEKFSIERLLFRMAYNEKTPTDTLKAVLPHLETVIAEELRQRELLAEAGLKTSKRMLCADTISAKRARHTADSSRDEENVCDVSGKICYLSMVVNEAEDTTYSLTHGLTHIQRRKNLKNCHLSYRFSQDEMESLLDHINQRLSSGGSTPKKKKLSSSKSSSS